MHNQYQYKTEKLILTNLTKITNMRKILLEGFLCIIFVTKITHAMHILPFMNTNADNLDTASKVGVSDIFNRN